MKFFCLIAGLALTAAANPILEERVTSTCKGPAYTILKVLPIATSFCSSYLHIPLSTVTASTKTIYVSTTTLTASTLTSTVATSTTTVATTYIEGAPLEATLAPRATLSIPAGLLSFAASELSSACSCLSVTPAKTTITSTTSKTTTSSVTSTTFVTATSDAVATITVHNPTACTNQALYTAAAGEVYEEYCNCDWKNNDITTAAAALNLPSCIEACQTYNEVPTNSVEPCVGVALAYFNGQSSPPTCFLKESEPGNCSPGDWYVEAAQIISS